MIDFATRYHPSRRHLIALLIGSMLLAGCGSDDPQASDGAAAATDGTAEPDAATGEPVTLPAIADVVAYKANAARTGVQPGPGIEQTPVLAWRTQLDCSIGERTAVIGSGTLVIGCDALLYGLDARTGAIRWTQDLDARLQGGAGTIEGGRVFIATSEAVEARNLTDGSLAWSSAARAGANPAASGGTIYVGTDDGRMLGLRADDGSIDFDYEAGAPAGGTMVDGTVFVNVEGGQFRAVDRVTGAVRWSHQVRSGQSSSPSISADTVYVAALQGGGEPAGELYALDRATGSVKWSQRTSSGLQLGPPIVDGDTVYAASEDLGVFALDARSGDIRWNAPSGEVYVPMATTGDIVYAAGTNLDSANGAVYAYRATDGTPLWTLELGARSASSPVVSGGMLFVGDEAGHVDAYAEPALVALIESAPTPGPTPSSTPAPLARLFGEATALDAGTLKIDHPYGMDVGPDGNVYVANTGRDEVLVLSPGGEVVRRWGSTGRGDGEFDFLRDKSDPGSRWGGVGVGPDGTVYVADPKNLRVQAFAPDGTFIRKWGRFGDGDGQFIDPIDVDVASDGSVLVVDDQRDDIQRFSADGTYLETIGSRGTGAGQLQYTGGILVDGQDRVYNADWGNGRIQSWDADGSVRWTFGSPGRFDGRFVDPRDVAVDSSGLVYALDEKRVQAITADGRQVVGVWTSPGADLGGIQIAGDTVWITAPWDSTIWRIPLEP